jgi:hypothetical protein
LPKVFVILASRTITNKSPPNASSMTRCTPTVSTPSHKVGRTECFDNVESPVNRLRLFVIVFIASLTFAYSTPAASLDTAKIEQLTGAKGKMDEKEGVFKVSLPRNDINVTAAGAKMTPPSR